MQTASSNTELHMHAVIVYIVIKFVTALFYKIFYFFYNNKLNDCFMRNNTINLLNKNSKNSMK